MTFDDFIVFPLDNPNNFYKDNFCLICSSKFDTEDIEKLLPYNRSSYLINTYFHLPDSYAKKIKNAFPLLKERHYLFILSETKESSQMDKYVIKMQKLSKLNF